jgi:hypothetical protein
MPVDQTTKRRIFKTGLTAHDPAKACPGFVLLTPMNDLRITLLIDMEGNEVHRWTHREVACQYGYLAADGNLFYNARVVGSFIRENPDLRHFVGGGIFRLDWDSNIVWEHTADQFHHHDGRALPHGGAIYLSMEEVPPEIKRRVQGGMPGEGPMFADKLVEIDAAGNTLWEWRVIEHLKPEDYPILYPCSRIEWTHFNSVTPLGDDRVMTSLRHQSTVLIIDKATGAVTTRLGPGIFHAQHDPHMLPNGNILLFDNGPHRTGSFRAFSRVLELKPDTGEIVWHYQDIVPPSFFSYYISGVDPLPNGNVLVCEGINGRIFQVTRDGEVVWEYISPHFGIDTYGTEMNDVFTARFYTKEQLPNLS